MPDLSMRPDLVMRPDLFMRNVEVRFAGLASPALAIPYLSIAAGERVALTGPSGSGKTTLINTLIGLDRVRQGQVAWGEVDLTSLPESRRDRWRARHVGLVMQDFHLFSGMSALDNVTLPLRLASVRAPRDLTERAEHLLARVGITRASQAVETMSRGQMQRVAVARALVGEPEILVADEPTASLDAEAGAAVADLILELAAEVGATLFVASHDPRFIARLDRVLRLENGRLQPAGEI